MVSQDVLLAAAVSQLGALAAVSPAVGAPAATSDVGADLQALIQLPFTNFFQIFGNGSIKFGTPPVQIFGLGSLANFIIPVNAATGAFFGGTPTGKYTDPITGATVTGTPAQLLQDAVKLEIASIQKVLMMPGQVIKFDLAVIKEVFSPDTMTVSAVTSAPKLKALTATPKKGTAATTNAGTSNAGTTNGGTTNGGTTTGSTTTGGTTTGSTTTGSTTTGSTKKDGATKKNGATKHSAGTGGSAK